MACNYKVEVHDREVLWLQYRVKRKDTKVVKPLFLLPRNYEELQKVGSYRLRHEVMKF